MPTLLMLIPVGIGLGMIQLTVSMVISRLASYLVSTAILLMSAYMQSVLLFPNVSMFARSVGRGNNYSLDFQHMYAGWLFVFEKFGYYK